MLGNFVSVILIIATELAAGSTELGGGAQCLQDRVISIENFAGQEGTLHFAADYVDGRENVRLTIGFDRVALLGL